MKPTKEYYRIKAELIIKNFEKRNFEGYYCDNIEEAKSKLLELLGEKKTIGYGGSMTLDENHIQELLSEKGHDVIFRENYKSDEEKEELKKKLITADAFLMSSNAITLNGELVNTDGNSNRICYLQFGPKEVYIIAGMNKVVKDVEAGIDRIKQVAAPINAIRLNRDTPCTKTGVCGNCFEGTICCNTVITRFSREKGRIKIILVGETLGY